MTYKSTILFFAALFIITLFLGVAKNEYNEKKITKIEKENIKLRQENKDYKWQLEQIPYIIENWCKGE